MWFYCTCCYSFVKGGRVLYNHRAKNEGATNMTPKQKVLSIRLAELIIKNHTFAKSIGLEVKNKFEKKSKEEN